MVSNQEQIALAVPVVNSSLCSSIGLHMNSFVRASEDVQDSCFRCCGGQGGRLSPGRTDPPASRPAPPRPTPPPRRAPPCPDPPVVCPGFGFDRLFKQLEVSLTATLIWRSSITVSLSSLPHSKDSAGRHSINRPRQSAQPSLTWRAPYCSQSMTRTCLA